MHIRAVGNILILFGALIFVSSAVADGFGFGGRLDFGPGQMTDFICCPAIVFISHSVESQAEQAGWRSRANKTAHGLIKIRLKIRRSDSAEFYSIPH